MVGEKNFLLFLTFSCQNFYILEKNFQDFHFLGNFFKICTFFWKNVFF